jgi:3-oxoacyl-[acyl-carrier-protein] synthase-3
MVAAEPSAGARRAWIVGAAHALPPRSVANEDLPASLEADPAGILKRTGIRSRYWADRGIATSDLGALAAQHLLEETGVAAAEIDCLIACSQTPDHFLPGIGVIIQKKVGLPEVPCFDIRDQCSSFLYALQIARAFIETGTYGSIMIVCAELHSHGLGREPRDAHIAALFGDGAGAVLIRPERNGAIPLTPVWQTLGADGGGEKRLRQRLWDMRFIPPWEPSEWGEEAHQVQYAEMDGEAVFRAAVRRMVSAGQACFRALDLQASDVDWLMPHQANATICKTVASILGFPAERVLSNIDRVGNCSSASLPILLSETLKNSRIQSGQRVLMLAFGAGYTWGGTLLESAQ